MEDIKHGENKFYIGEDANDPIAEVTYVPTGDTQLIIDHTYVSEDLRGQKIGEKLVKQVIDKAREENKKIIPLCPFAKKLMDENDEYQDVL